jgi:hypothetical protein
MGETMGHRDGPSNADLGRTLIALVAPGKIRACAHGSEVAQTALGGGEVSDAWTRIATPVRYCRLAKTLVKDDGAGMAAPLRVI